MAEAVILGALRTPFGRRGGALREVRPDALLAHTLSGLVGRAGIDPAQIEDVIGGTVTQAGEQGANLARLGVMLSGFPATVPAVSINRMCGSSQQAVHFASQAIAAGDMRYAVGCGVESMTRVPMFSNVVPGPGEPLSPGLGARYGDSLVPQGISAAQPTEREFELIACPTLKSVEGISR
jgi:acetyl-CoA acyltransferase